MFSPLQDLLSIFFPSYCYSCGQPLVGDERYLCGKCLLHLPTTHYAAVPDNLTEQRFMGRFPFQAATSLLYYEHGGEAQKLVHHIKYYEKVSFAEQMGRMLGRELTASGRFDQVELLVPIPLHPLKQLRRGYNQSELLCKGIAATFPRPICTNAVKRRTNTTSQTNKNRIQRMDNMQDVFLLKRPQAIEGKHILVVDDVITTGATTSACCQELLKAPDVTISIASLGIAGV